MQTYELFINGAWVPGSGDDVLEVVNPATEEVIGRVPQATTNDVISAVDAARRAFDEGPWGRSRPAERARVLGRFHDALEARKGDLVDLAVREAGSVQMIADMLQVQTPLDHLAWWAERAGTFSYIEPLPPSTGLLGLGQGAIHKEPVGVVAAITPFNFPVFLNLWKLGPALAMGNTVVLKPSPYTPLEAFILADILAELDLPPGVVNIVTGDVDAGEELTSNPKVDLVSFTGSDVVGRKVMSQASGSLKKVLLELGGKSANIVFEGTDLDAVAPGAVLAFTVHCGQACAMTSRILVQRSIHDELVAKMREFLEFFTVGDPADPTNLMGPLIREAQRGRVEEYVRIGLEEGAEVAYGGGRPAIEKGFFVEPTLFTGVDNSMRIAQEEIFGPVGVVIPFDDADDAVRLANDSRYGLGGAVWHPDPIQAYDVAKRLRTGLVQVNGGGGDLISQFGTFGGYKQSGVGRELSDHGLQEYCELKTIAWPAGR